MPKDSAGVYTLPVSAVNPAVGNTIIDTAAFNAQNADIASAITDSLDRQGRGGMAAPLSMGGFKITNLASAAASTDAARLGDVFSYLPPGAIVDFAMQAAPAGWLVCNGAAVSRTTYAALFAAIGTVWGAGDGVTTFNVPDIRGTVRRTFDAGRGFDPGRVFASLQTDSSASGVAVQGQAGGLSVVSATADTRMKNYAVQTCIRF